MDAAQLSAAEHAVWDAFLTGAIVDFRIGSLQEDDPTHGEDWGPERQIRAVVLAELLKGAVAVEASRGGTVRVRGARISGMLTLEEDTEVKHPLWLVGCHMAEGIKMSGTSARAVILQECNLGPIGLIGPNIAGDFVVSGAFIDGGGGTALAADRLTVSGGMFCDDRHATRRNVGTQGCYVQAFSGRPNGSGAALETPGWMAMALGER